MKKYIFLPLTLIIIIITSCSDDIVTTSQYEPNLGTRAIITDDDDVSLTNPNLLTNWENIDAILLSSNKYVSAPWANGCTTELTSEFRKDIKKEDGWDMLFHTFKKLDLDEKQNYMCFYNKFTGMLKVFYYNETTVTGGTQTNWCISQSSATDKPLRILDSPNFFSKADDEDSNNASRSISITNNVGNKNQGLTRGWNGFEYQIPRYSSEFLTAILKSVHRTLL